MSDLISRSALYNGIKLHYQPTDQKYPSDRYWAIGYNAGLERGLYSIVHAHAVDAVPVEKLGKLGKYMMPYTGDPRGHMEWSGIGDVRREALLMDTFEDVDGSIWRPVLETVLQELLKRADVVRCKDCKHCLLDLSGREAHLCMRMENGFPVRKRRKADDFCSYGERKDND